MMHRIDIPSRDPAMDAAAIVIDPRKALRNPMAQALATTWARGEWSEAQFENAARNLLILNPTLGL
jgi:hypothetical protein